LNKVTRFISDILFDKEINLDLFPSKNNDKFWDKFVTIGSSHLVIPSLYYKLKERDFIKLLSDELVSYLKEIYNQNLHRNTKLLKEVNQISSLLMVNDIDHVFLKGAALISSIYKESIGIRMVGDIDILISENHISKAKNLLKREGYNFFERTFKQFIKQEKHLERQVNDKKIFAVELHFSLTPKRNIHNKKFISSRKLFNKIFIPNKSDLLYHTIINFQKNDLGSLRTAFHFRTLFDIMNLISKKPDLIEKLPNSIHISKIQVIMKKFNLIDHNIPLNLYFFSKKFDLINSIYIFSILNKLLTNTFILIPLKIRIMQIKALFLNHDYRLYALKKIGIIK